MDKSKTDWLYTIAKIIYDTDGYWEPWRTPEETLSPNSSNSWIFHQFSQFDLLSTLAIRDDKQGTDDHAEI